MAEIVGAFLRADLWDEGANSSIEGRNSSGGELAQERLEFAVRHLNRIKDQGNTLEGTGLSPPLSQSPPECRTQVDSAVIHHRDVMRWSMWVPSTARHCEEQASGHDTLDHLSSLFQVPEVPNVPPRSGMSHGTRLPGTVPWDSYAASLSSSSDSLQAFNQALDGGRGRPVGLPMYRTRRPCFPEAL